MIQLFNVFLYSFIDIKYVISDQVGVRAKGFEFLTHRCRLSIYELAVI